MSRTVRRLLEHKGRAIHAVEPLDTVFRAVEAMAERGIGALLVMEGERLLGIVLRAGLRPTDHPAGP